MKDLLDWITAIAAVVLVYAALRHPLYPPRGGKEKATAEKDGADDADDAGR
ncbi:hypothetical protein ACKI2N_022655 [Cupriavidus sp. 30B13]|uniref:hypothetical protein n=1 Tax=Cupriavidus sp. 30B13 TaxID=3384241 RepID=UPI003B8F8AB7